MTGRKWFVAGGLPLGIPLARLALPRRVRIDGFFEIRAGSYGDPSHPFRSWSLDEDPILRPIRFISDRVVSDHALCRTSTDVPIVSEPNQPDPPSFSG